MAKAFKGQFAKLQTVNTQGEFIGGREAVAALGQEGRFTPSFEAQNVAADFNAFSITASNATAAAETVSDFDDGFLVVKAHGGEFTVLDCLSDKDLMLHYLQTDGASSPVDSPVTVIPNPLADEVGLAMAVGGTLSGNIDFTGDTDDITIFLVSGQKYLFSERGTGPNALNDTFLQLRSPTNVLVAQDDDGGNGLNSIFTYTATVTGNFTIRAAAFDNGPSDPGVGGWTVDVRVQGVDAIGDTNATSVPLSLGTTFGFRETGTGGTVVVDPNANISGDLDRYSVNLIAGHFYSWKVAGGIDSDGVAGSTEIDTYIRLLDSAGNLIAKNDDNGSTDFSSSLGFFAQATRHLLFRRDRLDQHVRRLCDRLPGHQLRRAQSARFDRLEERR